MQEVLSLKTRSTEEVSSKLGQIAWKDFISADVDSKTNVRVGKVWHELKRTNSAFRSHQQGYSNQATYDSMGLDSRHQIKKPNDNMRPFMFSEGDSSDLGSRTLNDREELRDPETTYVDLDVLEGVISDKKLAKTYGIGPSALRLSAEFIEVQRNLKH